MASPDAILAAYKANARVGPTPAQNGISANMSAPGLGQISPLSAQINAERGYANTYGPFLPRDPRTFTSGAFGPFAPVMPVPVDEPAEGASMPDARLFEYLVGWNLPVGQPGTEGVKLADFGTLKTLADLYSVARACIELRKNEIAGLDWDIVPTSDAAKAYNNRNSLMRDFGERRGKVRKFFEKPDPDYMTFTDFMLAALEDVFVFDAFSLLLRPKRGRGLGRGILGSDLDCIELISGPTIRPLLGLHGEKPRPPAPAYQQYLYGVARSDYMQLINERDLEENGMLGAEVNSWSADQFIYRPLVPRRWTPYGFPPVERALIPVMSGIQKQAYQLDFFKEGTIPAVYISPGDVNMTPNQIRELQNALNAFAGDPAWHHKVIVLPPGSKVDPQKPTDVADQFDDVVMTQVCQAFDVNPMELGILPKIAATATPSQVKQLAQAGGTVHERLSTKPTLKWFCDIFDAILHDVLHQYDMRFTFEGLQEDAEQNTLTQLLVEQVQNGLRSVDEAREQLELQPWGLPMTSEPVFFSAAGPMPFTQPALPAATPGQSQGGQQDSRNREVSRRAPTPGPAPLQQAGRAGGVAAPTPGHAAAQGAVMGSRASVSAPVRGPSATGSVTSSKNQAPPAAVKSELEALVRHLNKGRRIGTWVPRHLDPTTMAIITEDLGKGLTAEEAVSGARTVLLGKTDYEWLPKASSREIPWTEITEGYTARITGAFDAGIDDFADVLRQWWSGQLPVTRQSLLDSFSDILYRHLRPVLRELWAEAWRAYDETAGGYFEAWADSHGRDILENIVTSRMKKVDNLIREALEAGEDAEWVIRQLRDVLDVDNRAEMIATTEAGNAGNDAAMRSFTDAEVSYKIWVTRHDGKVCAVCRRAEAEGAVPVDSLFGIGLVGPPAHPRCRCHLEPATADEIVKSDSSGLHGNEKSVWCSRKSCKEPHHGEYGAAGILIRHKGDDGTRRFLLQKRSVSEDTGSGTWGLPGGAILEGESPLEGMWRESQEEMGPFPPGVVVHHHITDDHGPSSYDQAGEKPTDRDWQFHTFVADSPEQFTPAMHESQTPDESDGWGWFTADEVGKLPLHPGVKHAWPTVRDSDDDTTITKCIVRRVDLSGQVFYSGPAECPHGGTTGFNAPGGGGPLKMPHDANDIWHESEDDYHTGGAALTEGGGTSGTMHDGSQPKTRTSSMPAGNDGLDMGDACRSFQPPNGPFPDRYAPFWEAGQGHGTGQAGSTSPGWDHGIAPSVRTDKPLKPGHGITDGDDRPYGYQRKPKVRKGESAAAAVRAQLEENFPPQALQWLDEANWTGPHVVPLKHIDFSDMETWSAYHEPDRVRHFEQLIRDGEDFNPPVLIKAPGHARYRLVDGHHRALAYYRLGRPLARAWIGLVPPGVVHVAEETHSSQVHQGASRENG